MKNPMPVILLVALVALGGCASAGTKVEQSAVDQIHKGSTTKAEVIALLGQPIADTLGFDGREIMVWSYSHAQIKAATFIPIAGAFVGGSDMKMQTFQVILNKDGIVENYLLSNGAIDARMGRG